MRLVSGRWVLPITAPPLAQGAVVLDSDDRILAVGRRVDLRREYSHLPETRADGVILPGLVNAHTHVDLSALADQIPGGQGLVAWVGQVMQRRSQVSVDATNLAIESAAASLVESGTAAIGDVTSNLSHIHLLARAGLRGVVFHELVGSRDLATGDAIQDAARERASVSWPAAFAYTIAPHAPYSVGPDLLARIFTAATAPTTIHVAEDPDELSLLRDGTGAWVQILARMGVAPRDRSPGLDPVAYLETLGAFAAQPPLLVHMVHASADDRARAARHRAPVVLCPRSNLQIGGRLPDVMALYRDQIPLCLGTDSLASSPSLSLWGELATLAAHVPGIPAWVLMHAATAGGAQAMGLGDMGHISPGARPGLIDVLVDDDDYPIESLVRSPSPTIRWLTT